MELHRYDIIEAELDYGNGSIQRKRIPYIIVSNEKGTTNATIITVMPLISAKKKRLPAHECLEAHTYKFVAGIGMNLKHSRYAMRNYYYIFTL